MRIIRRSDIPLTGLELGLSVVGRGPLDRKASASFGRVPARGSGAGGRSLIRRWLLVLAAVAALGLANAAEIWVTTTEDELDTVFPNITCSLREAINTVNDAVAGGVGGCVVSGTLGQDDTILLLDETHEVTRSADGYLCSLFDQDCGDLDVRRDVVIAGVAARTSIVLSRLDGSFGDEFAISVAPGVTAVFRDLTVTATSQAGSGGISNAGDLTLERVIVRGNHRLEGDGGGIDNDGDLTVRDSLVAGNASQGYGGGIAHNGPTLFVQNSTITGNDARYQGGGIYVFPRARLFGEPVSTRTDLWSVTIAGNRTGVGFAIGGSAGAGVHLDAGWLDPYDFRVENTLIAGNTNASTGQPADCSGTFESLGFNLIGVNTNCVGFGETGDLAGSAAAPLDPLLLPLRNYGGPTNTRALAPGSPAIDAGPLQILDSCLATDQRGLPRANDGDGNGFLNCDIGAYEAPAASVPAEANLRVQLFDLPDPVATSAQLQYQVLVTNDGPDPASSVEITFVEPAGADVVGASAACAQASGSPDTFTCAMGSLAAGDSTGVSFDLTAPATATTVIATASVGSTTADPFPGDNSAQEATVIAASASADLAFQIRALGYAYVLITEPILYDLVVTNAGPSAASSVVVSAQIPAGSAFVTASPECTRTVINNLDLLSCTAGNLPSGATRTFELFLGAPAQPGTVTLTASASTSTADPSIANNSDAFTTVVQDVPNADLFIAVNGPAQVAANSPFVLNLIPFNNGPDASPSVFVRLDLAFGAAVVDAPAFCSDQGSYLRCSLGEVAAFGSVPSYPVTVRAPAIAGSATFTAAIEGASIDPLPSNDAASLEVEVVADEVHPPPDPGTPALDVTEGPSSPADGTVGEGETGVPALQVRATNSGTAALQVTSLTLRASGTGGDASGIAGVGLFLDLDGDGAVGATDGLVATGTFTQDDGDLTLPITTALQPGAQQDWLVVVDFSHTAAARPLPWLALGGAFLGLGTVGLRRRRWLATTLAILALSLAVGACGSAPPPGGNPTSSTYVVTLVDVQAADLATAADAVVSGLPIQGATLTVQD